MGSVLRSQDLDGVSEPPCWVCRVEETHEGKRPKGSILGCSGDLVSRPRMAVHRGLA